MFFFSLLAVHAAAYAPNAVPPHGAVRAHASPMMVASLEAPVADGAEEEEELILNEAPLSGPARVKRALTFYSKVVPILAAYKVAEKKAEVTGASEEEAEKVYQELHDWGSERLEGAIQELKGFYVKTGQVMRSVCGHPAEPGQGHTASKRETVGPLVVGSGPRGRGREGRGG